MVMRLSSLDQLIVLRPVNRQAASVTAGGVSTDNTCDQQPLRAPNYIEPPRRGMENRHVQARERLAQRRAEFEAMDDAMLELEAATLKQNLDSIKADLQQGYAPGLGHPDHDWQRRAERAVSVIRAELTLAQSELRQRAQAKRDGERHYQEAQRRLQAEEQQRRQEAHNRLVHESRALKEARIASNEARGRDFGNAFVDQARILLEREIFELLIEATEQALGIRRDR